MTESRLRTTVGVFIVLSHFGLLFLVVALTVIDKFTMPELFTTLGLMLPLFAAFTTVIVKSFLAGHDGVKPNSDAVEIGRLFVALLIPTLPVAFILIAIFWKAFGSLEFESFSAMIGLTETAFGIYVGFVVKAFFEPTVISARRSRTS